MRWRVWQSKGGIKPLPQILFCKKGRAFEKISILDKENFRLNAQREKLEEAKETQINYMWEEYELTPAAAAGLRDASLDNAAQLKKAIQSLKGRSGHWEASM